MGERGAYKIAGEGELERGIEKGKAINNSYKGGQRGT